MHLPMNCRHDTYKASFRGKLIISNRRLTTYGVL